MSVAARTERLLSAYPTAAAILYAALVVLFVATIVTTVLDLADRRDAVAAAEAVLAQLESRNGARPAAASAAARIPPGSPFLEGASVSVASAALLQRVATVVTQVRGNIVSSQVDIQGPRVKEGFVSVVMTLELDAASVQPLLYNIEAGMPFLFVDQFVAQIPTGATAPAGATTPAGGRLRVLLGVSGQWQGAK